MYDENAEIVEIGPIGEMDTEVMLDQFHEGGEQVHAAYYETGPFESALSYLTAPLDHRREPSHALQKGCLKILRLWMSLIPEAYEAGKQFVLSHPDLDIQNVIVGEDGELRGIIDWDGVAAVPRCIGNASLPSWLTRDWNPATSLMAAGRTHRRIYNTTGSFMENSWTRRPEK